MPGLSPRGNNVPDATWPEAGPPGTAPPAPDGTGTGATGLPGEEPARGGPSRPAGRLAATVRRAPGGHGPDEEPPAREIKVSFSEAIGGPRGIVDSSLPTIAFVALNGAAGLTSGIIAAAVVGVGIFVLRMVRGEPKQQAFSGLFAVGVAAYIASRTGRGKDYFLVSILRNAGAVLVGVASLAVRRPLAGYVMAGLDARYADWREHRDTVRAANWATGVWIVVYLLRFGVQGVLYLADQDGWLAAANVALGLPLFGLAVLATLGIVRRLAPAARFEPDGDETEAAEAADDGDGGPVSAARAAARNSADD
jgi:hypothetical protein